MRSLVTFYSAERHSGLTSEMAGQEHKWEGAVLGSLPACFLGFVGGEKCIFDQSSFLLDAILNMVNIAATILGAKTEEHSIGQGKQKQLVKYPLQL